VLGATRLTDSPAIRLIVASFAAFHLATAALELLYLALDGITGVLIANIVVRLVAGTLFILVWRSRRS